MKINNPLRYYQSAFPGCFSFRLIACVLITLFGTQLLLGPSLVSAQGESESETEGAVTEQPEEVNDLASEDPPEAALVKDRSYDYSEDTIESTRRSVSKSKLCKTIYLMYTRADDIIPTLKDLFESDINAGNLTLTHNPVTNAIIMRTTEVDSPLGRDVLDVISSLDFRSGQVLIDVLVVEMSVNDDDLVNAEWKDLIRSPAGSRSSLANVSVDHGFISQYDPTAITEGFKAFITSHDKMKLFLNALSKKGKVQVVSSPHIVAANHRQAVFKIGEQLPLISSVRPSDAGPIKSFEIKEVGLELAVTPHINRSGEIDMEINQKINAVDQYNFQEGTARMSSREAQTNLCVADGETLVLGGFIEDKKDRTEHRVPLLSNIPVLGKVFTQVKKTSKKTELMVFLTPKILNTVEDGRTVTKTQVAKTQDLKNTKALIELRKKIASTVQPGQEIIIDRRSFDWRYGLGTAEQDILVWQVPRELEPEKLSLPLKGACPFGFGPSKRLLPIPIRTYLKPSDGVVLMKEFEIPDPARFASLDLKVSSNNAAAVYINGKLVEEDPMMKMKDGHDSEFWNREKSDIPVDILKKGMNNIVVLLANDVDTTDAYFDMMLLGNKQLR